MSYLKIKERTKAALEGLPLDDLQVKVFEVSGCTYMAQVISPSFEGMEDWERQRIAVGKLMDDLGLDDMRWVEFVFTDTPREVADAEAEEQAAEAKS